MPSTQPSNTKANKSLHLVIGQAHRLQESDCAHALFDNTIRISTTAMPMRSIRPLLSQRVLTRGFWRKCS